MKAPLAEAQLEGQSKLEWPVEEPPADFAERTVRVLLEAREDPVMVRPRPRRRWLVMPLAAITVSATAWGAFQLLKESPRPEMPAPTLEEPPEPPAPPLAPPRQSSPRPISEVAPASAASFAAEPRRTPASKSSSRVPPKEPSVEPEPLPPPRPLQMPRCECGPGAVVCSCVE